MADSQERSNNSSNDSSNTSSATPSRPQSVLGAPGFKPQPKVKFFNPDGHHIDGDSDGEQEGISPGRNVPPSEDVTTTMMMPSDWVGRTNMAATTAQQRASRLANQLGTTTPVSRPNSTANSPLLLPSQGPTSPLLSPEDEKSEWLSPTDAIPLSPIKKEDEVNEIRHRAKGGEPDIEKQEGLDEHNENLEEARRLVRTLTKQQDLSSWNDQPRSGTETPAVDKNLYDVDYIPPPSQYRPSIVGALLTSQLTDLKQSEAYAREYGNFRSGKSAKYFSSVPHSRTNSKAFSENFDASPPSSGRVTPKRPKWYDKGNSHNQSSTSISTLLAHASAASAAAAAPHASHKVRPNLQRSRSSQNMIATAVDMIKHPANYFHSQAEKARLEEERVIQDVAEIIACRKYLKKLARCLMIIGAPTHRIEEYMKTSARSLQIDSDFLYLPGSMIVSINDKITMSTEVTLVRESQGVDLGRFKDVFAVYKLVIHGKYSAEEGSRDLDLIMTRPDRYSIWFRILAYGIAAIGVGPFAFWARPIDFAPSFALGCTLGYLQLVVSARSERFAHVFEVLAAVIISFVARGLGSIYSNGSPLFCFSAIAQSSIALILPGYIVLCAALELQCKQFVSGSVRMVYAIIYSLFLAFGILIGTVVMGLIYPGAQNDVTCGIPDWWNAADLDYKLIYVRFIWVPIFAVCLAIINQAKWQQIPAMTLIAVCGYQANFWVSTKIANNVQVANAIGAFVIGCMANLYSRFFHGLAAAAMLPSIFVQVPSGLAASGSIVAGITSANQITGNQTGISVINNGTAGFLDAQNAADANSLYSGTIFNVGYGMVQVAIGISVGLYLSALVVYPIGKRRSGIFAF